MMRGITGGVKFGAGDKGNSIEASLMADRSGLELLAKTSLAGSTLLGAQLSKLSGRARGFDAKSAQRAVAQTASGAAKPAVSQDDQVKLDFKWEQERGKSTRKMAPPSISWVRLAKVGDENKAGVAASFGLERKVGG